MQSADRDHAKSVYQHLFHPQSIAVIGASNDALKPGGRVLKNIKDHGYTGDLWAVNPKTPDVQQLPTYPSVASLPAAPELALVAIPAPFVLETLQVLADMGTGAVIVLTSGFGEKDAAGKALEQQMLQVANAAGMALIGPNCSGFLTPTYKGKFAGLIPTLPGGAVDIISGSGATVDYVMEWASKRGLSFGTVLNLGNSIQMGVEDLLELYDENYGDDNARILMLYLESVKKPRKLLTHARSLIRKGCMLVGIKAGATAAGERAAASHTGAMATSDTAVEALFAKAGIIRVRGRGELIETACALASLKGPLKGKRACVITDAGGPGVMLCDELNRQGMETPQLGTATQRALAEILPKESSLTNPIDALPSRTAQQIEASIRILGTHERDRIDVIAVLLGDSGMSDNMPIYEVVRGAMQEGPIPVIPMFSSITSSAAKIDNFIASGQNFFVNEVSLGQALGHISRWQFPEAASEDLDNYDAGAIEAALADQTGVLSPETVTAVLDGAGFRLPSQIEVFTEDQLAPACAKVGFPLAMKVIGPLHKTDVGGVRLGIADAAEAQEIWQAMLKIPAAEGVLLQPMVSGLEVILGASREGEFGHLVMFGLGGVYAEVLKDVSFALAPLSREESLGMIQGIRSFPILKGVRGEAGMDIDTLTDYVRRLGRLVSDFPQIREIDLNPIKGTAKDLYAVDARMILDGSM
jgi:acetyltransferase